MGWQQTALDDSFLDYWQETFDGVAPPQRFVAESEVAPGSLTALVGREPVAGDGGERWHLSLQADQNREPTFLEFICAASELAPGVAFAVSIPPRSWWLNVQPRVLHAWEYHDPALIAQWVASRAHARRSLALLGADTDVITEFEDLAFEAVVVEDAEFVITSWSPAAEQLFGYTAQEAIGRSAEDLLPNADGHPRTHSTLRRDGAAHIVRSLIGKHGEPIEVEGVGVANYQGGSVAGYTIRMRAI